MILTGRLSGELTFLYYRFAPAADLSALATGLDCAIRTIFEIPPACASSFTSGLTRSVCILSKITGSTSSRWHVSPLYISRIFSVLTFPTRNNMAEILDKTTFKMHVYCFACFCFKTISYPLRLYSIAFKREIFEVVQNQNKLYKIVGFAFFVTHITVFNFVIILIWIFHLFQQDRKINVSLFTI